MTSKHQIPDLPQPRKHWGFYLLTSIVLLTILPLLPHPYSDTQLLVGAIGGLWALAFYLQSRHAEDARFLKDLLHSFSERYDRLNNRLRAADRRAETLSETDQDVVVDYFNLCAEEWLFWKMGFVPDAVWRAWENGMRQYGKDPRVKKLWSEERKTNSYYGFEFPVS